jgi:hypothetical protein
VNASPLRMGAEVGLVFDAGAVELVARLAADALRRGMRLTADEHRVVDQVVQLTRALRAAAGSEVPEPSVPLSEVDGEVGEDWLTGAQVARRLGKSESYVRRCARFDLLPARKVGGAWRFPPWIEKPSQPGMV